MTGSRLFEEEQSPRRDRDNSAALLFNIDKAMSTVNRYLLIIALNCVVLYFIRIIFLCGGSTQDVV